MRLGTESKVQSDANQLLHSPAQAQGTFPWTLQWYRAGMGYRAQAIAL